MAGGGGKVVGIFGIVVGSGYGVYGQSAFGLVIGRQTMMESLVFERCNKYLNYLPGSFSLCFCIYFFAILVLISNISFDLYKLKFNSLPYATLH